MLGDKLPRPARLSAKSVAAAFRSLLPPEVMMRHRVVPFAFAPGTGRRTLLVAMVDPANLAALDDVRFAAGMAVRGVAVHPEDIDEVLGIAPARPQRAAARNGDRPRGIDFRPDGRCTLEDGWYFPGSQTRF
ncbi:MAG TPA: hypothetical protein VMT17_03830 [Anaeromyxobacteraceae bacterium]|nr:hypothetical protein [Anaeromyxobacteraceae bacterium]